MTGAQLQCWSVQGSEVAALDVPHKLSAIWGVCFVDQGKAMHIVGDTAWQTWLWFEAKSQYLNSAIKHPLSSILKLPSMTDALWVLVSKDDTKYEETNLIFYSNDIWTRGNICM
jgi:hypothetical protein